MKTRGYGITWLDYTFLSKVSSRQSLAKIGSEAAFVAGSLLTRISAIVLLVGKLLSLLEKQDPIEGEGVEVDS